VSFEDAYVGEKGAGDIGRRLYHGRDCQAGFAERIGWERP
jgi:hypothetical protein